MPQTAPNPYRISVRQLAEDNGCTVEEMCEAATFDSVAPACCREGCEVEPDGRCPHGCPSVLVAMGMI